MQERNRVTYEGYVELMRKEVEKRTGKHVIIEKVNKNNGLVLDGLVIVSEENNVSPNIYLNSYFAKFLAYGKEAVAEEIIRVYERNKPKAVFDVSIFTEKEKVSPLIKMKIINYDKNKSLLAKVPHVKILDLAVVFMVVLESDCDKGFGTILIHDVHLKFWDMKTDDLYKLARENMRNDFEIVSMVEVMKEVFENLTDEELRASVLEPEVDMYVLTNYMKLHGAVGMLHTELLNQFMKENGFSTLLILPSSIHECLLLPYDDSMEEFDFEGMVKDANVTELKPEEILSDSVYIYDGSELKIFE